MENVVNYLKSMPDNRKRECARLVGESAKQFYSEQRNIEEFNSWVVEYRKNKKEGKNYEI